MGRLNPTRLSLLSNTKNTDRNGVMSTSHKPHREKDKFRKGQC